MKRQDLLRVSLDSETNVQYDTPYKLVIYGTTELTDMSYFQTQWRYLMAEKVQVDFHQDFWESKLFEMSFNYLMITYRLICVVKFQFLINYDELLMWTAMNEYLTNISNDYMLKAFENIFLWFLNHLKGWHLQFVKPC